jgi:hypothetical protein
MAVTRILRPYNFVDKDPVIDEVRTVITDEGLFKKLGTVADLSSLSRTTLDNWFHGDTKRPQYASVMAVMLSLGYDRKWIKSREINLDKELEFARAWLKRERVKRQRSKRTAKRATKRA